MTLIWNSLCSFRVLSGNRQSTQTGQFAKNWITGLFTKMWTSALIHIAVQQTTPNLVTYSNKHFVIPMDSVVREKGPKRMILFCFMMFWASAGKAQSWELTWRLVLNSFGGTFLICLPSRWWYWMELIYMISPHGLTGQLHNVLSTGYWGCFYMFWDSKRKCLSKQGRSRMAIYKITSKATEHWFCYIVLVTLKSPRPAQVLRFHRVMIGVRKDFRSCPKLP